MDHCLQLWIRIILNNEAALTNLVRPSLDEMSTWIYNDFQFAADNLPNEVKERGRYTSDYAKFCMMKHCLNEGEHMTGYYDKAMQMYQELSKDNRYSLFKKGIILMLICLRLRMILIVKSLWL